MFSLAVTVQFAINFPSTVVAKIIAVPYPIQTTLPLATTATAGFDEVQVTLFSVAFVGNTVAVSFSLCPISVKLTLPLFNSIPVTGVRSSIIVA